MHAYRAEPAGGPSPQIRHTMSVMAHVAVVARLVGVEVAAELELVVLRQCTRRDRCLFAQLLWVMHIRAILCTVTTAFSCNHQARPCTCLVYTQVCAVHTSIGTLSSSPLTAKASLVIWSEPPHSYRFIHAQLMHPMSRVAQEVVVALPCTASLSPQCVMRVTQVLAQWALATLLPDTVSRRGAHQSCRTIHKASACSRPAETSA